MLSWNSLQGWWQSFLSNLFIYLAGIALIFRSSLLEVFCKKCVLKMLAKFKVKHFCQSIFFNKVAGLKPATLWKKRLWHRSFPANFAKFLRTPFFKEHFRWLVLSFSFCCVVINNISIIAVWHHIDTVVLSLYYYIFLCNAYQLPFFNVLFFFATTFPEYRGI